MIGGSSERHGQGAAGTVSCPAPDPVPGAGGGAAVPAGDLVGSGDLDLYSCNGFITAEQQVTVRIWSFPDGSGEVLATRSTCKKPGPDDLGSDLLDKLPPSDSISIPASTRFDPDHPVVKFLRPCRTWQGDLIGYQVSRSVCPALVEADRLRSEIGNGRRAQSRFRRLARFNDFRYMTTLTLPASGDRSRRGVQRLFRAFVMGKGQRLFHSRYGGWLAVLEPHVLGGYHLHVLHRNRLQASMTRALWTQHVLRNGYTLPAGSNAVRTHERYFGSSRKAAGYAAKYLGKGFLLPSDDRHKGQHRYLCSQGLSDGCRVAHANSFDHVRDLFPASFCCNGDHAFGEWLYLAWHGGGDPGEALDPSSSA